MSDTPTLDELADLDGTSEVVYECAGYTVVRTYSDAGWTEHTEWNEGYSDLSDTDSLA